VIPIQARRTDEQVNGQRNERTNEKGRFFQLFHGKNKSHFEDNDHVRLVVRKHAEFDFFSACSWQNRPPVYISLHYIIMIPS